MSALCCSKATLVKFDLDAVVAKIDNVGVEGVDTLGSSRETIMPGDYTGQIGLYDVPPGVALEQQPRVA